MKDVTEIELVELLSQQLQINFLAAAITPWHAMGIDATIYTLQSRGIQLFGYIIIVNHNMTGNGLKQEHFHTKENDEIRFITVRNDSIKETFLQKLLKKSRLYHYYLKNENEKYKNNVFYWIVPLKPSYEMIPSIMKVREKSKLRIYLIDEGIGGTYLTSTLRWMRIAIKEGTFKEGLRAIWTFPIRDKVFLSRLKKRKSIIYFQLLARERGKWVPNMSAVNAYRNILQHREIIKKFSSYEGAVVISSDMLKQTGHITGDEDLNIYEAVCRRLEEMDIACILKPHPRETDTDRYSGINCIMETEKNVAQEVIFGSIEMMPICIIGFASTTLVTANLLFGIEAISLNRIIWNYLSTDRKVFKKFENTFPKIIKFPETIEELTEIITNKFQNQK